MESDLFCPVCHQAVKLSDYFCPNCGKNLKPVPPSTAFTKQLMIYTGSLLLPPMGLIWGYQYLRFPEPKSKIIGWLAIVITLVSLVLTIIWTIQIVNTVNTQVNQQLELMGGY